MPQWHASETDLSLKLIPSVIHKNKQWLQVVAGLIDKKAVLFFHSKVHTHCRSMPAWVRKIDASEFLNLHVWTWEDTHACKCPVGYINLREAADPNRGRAETLKERRERVNTQNAISTFSSDQIWKSYCRICVCLGLEAKASIFRPQLGSWGCAKGRWVLLDGQKNHAQSKGGGFSFRQSGARKLPDEFL